MNSVQGPTGAQGPTGVRYPNGLSVLTKLEIVCANNTPYLSRTKLYEIETYDEVVCSQGGYQSFVLKNWRII